MGKIKLTESQLTSVIKKISKAVLKEDEDVFINCKTKILIKKWNNSRNEFGVSVSIYSPSGVTFSSGEVMGEVKARELAKAFGVRIVNDY